MKKVTFYFFDTLILVLSLMLMLVYKTDLGYRITSHYLSISLCVIVSFLVFSLAMKKSQCFYRRSIWGMLGEAFQIDFIALAAIAIVLVFSKTSDFSRLLIFGGIFLTMLIESLWLLACRQLLPPNHIQMMRAEETFFSWIKMLGGIRFNRYGWLVVDILTVSVAFLFFTLLKPATFRSVLPMYWERFIVLLGIWVLISFGSGKYRLHEKSRLGDMLFTILKTDFLILALVCVLIFALKLFMYSRLLVFGTMLLTGALELLIAYLYYSARAFMLDNPAYAYTTWVTQSRLLEEDVEALDPEPEAPWQPRYDPGFARLAKVEDSILIPLLNRYLEHKEDLFLFLNDSLALENIHKNKVEIVDSDSYYSVEIQEENSLEGFINFHRINDVRWINKYLIRVNQVLQPKGVLIGCCETLEQRHRNIEQSLFEPLASIVYLVDFLIHRVCPKISWLKGFYFSLTKGLNRPLSKCEILGRLYYCGFRVQDVTESENRMYFIAIKEKAPSSDASPSYGPLFRMKRFGKNEKPIYVYKFRTMHPYAEYLQHYMVERYGYGDKGKIGNDFRVTVWGRFLRKLWLDELPQLMNFAKGDLALVGVRPLSERFLREYPPELRQERARYKPGCVPPYVALRMQRVEDYMESERIYLEQKRKHPFWTDVKFLFWAVFNILANRIRSE